MKFEDGTTAIICGTRQRRQYCACGHASDFLCDWKVPARKSGTCDAPICAKHALAVGPDKHLCPLHQKAFAEWKRRHPGIDLAPPQKSLFEEKPSP